MSKLAIVLKRISKQYHLQSSNKPTLSEVMLFKKKLISYWALRNINLQVDQGERLGILGPNGSGKTTLLKIIAGITAPTSGNITVTGKIVSLIDLSAGFHPEFTGIENIYLNGLLLGMAQKEIDGKLNKIIDFADIGKFISAPLYTYSSGMALRLGFSIAVHTEPDILLLDEKMEVGDQNFKSKSSKKLKQFFQQGKTIIIVSHNLDYLSQNCNRVVWLDKGLLKLDAEASQVISAYKKINK